MRDRNGPRANRPGTFDLSWGRWRGFWPARQPGIGSGAAVAGVSRRESGRTIGKFCPERHDKWKPVKEPERSHRESYVKTTMPIYGFSNASSWMESKNSSSVVCLTSILLPFW